MKQQTPAENKNEKIEAPLTPVFPVSSTSLPALQQETLAILFHELRNPLNGMLGNAQLMRANLNHLLIDIDEHRDGPKMHCNLPVLYRELQKLKKKLQTIEYCGKDQLTILNHVLDFSKLEQSAVTLESKTFAILHDVFQPLIDAYSTLSQEKGVLLSVTLPKEDPLLIGDPYRLKQILTNLLSNALKFAIPVMNQPAQITLSLALNYSPDETHQALNIQIKNTGPGLSEKQIEQLFRPYAQSDFSITRRFGGTGLGLVVCKQLLALMKGEIVCISSVSEQWVQFDIQLSLPAAAQTASFKRRPAEQKSRSPKKKTRPPLDAVILLVEDNKINQKIIKEMLKKYRCIVKTADDGREAITLYSKQVYSLILMDIQMPGMDGLTATRAIRALEKSALDSNLTPIPIIGLSGDALTEQRENALQAGMNDYLTKPILEKTLYDIITQYARQTPLSSALSISSGRSDEFGSSHLYPKSGQLTPRHSPPQLLFSRCRRVSQDGCALDTSSLSNTSFSAKDNVLRIPSGEVSESPFSSENQLTHFHYKQIPKSKSLLQLGVSTSGCTERKQSLSSETKLTPSNLFSSGSSSSIPLFSLCNSSSMMHNPGSDSLEGFVLDNYTPVHEEKSLSTAWALRLAALEGGHDLLAKALVMLDAIGHYFQVMFQNKQSSIDQVSMTVTHVPQGELKQWVDRLDTLYQTASSSQQLLITAAALGHWQSLQNQGAPKISSVCLSHSLQIIEFNLTLWKTRMPSRPKSQHSKETRSTCCLIT